MEITDEARSRRMQPLRERYFARKKLRECEWRARRRDVGLQTREAAGDHTNVTGADSAGGCSTRTDPGDYQQRNKQDTEAHDGLLSPLTGVEVWSRLIS
jgi:hypothetical protein